MLCSYGAKFARKWGLRARRLMMQEGKRRWGLTISQESRAKDAWDIAGHDGGMMTTGIDSESTGSGAALLVIDDPVKNAAQASSITYRDATWEWFESVASTRLDPDGVIIVIQTRWHRDDLAGRILEREGDKWRQLIFPAVAERDETYTYLRRRKGEALWPARWPVARLLENRRSDYWWSALYQQHPVPRSGMLFKTDGVKIVPRADWPGNLPFARGWDLASTARERGKHDPDYTVGTLAAAVERAGRRQLWIADVVRIQAGATERDALIARTAARDGPGVHQRIEAVAGYKDTADRMESLLEGRSIVDEVPATKDLIYRSDVFEPAFSAGEVYLREGAWNDEWIMEFSEFPHGAHDDQVASLATACEDSFAVEGSVSFSR
jgi:predicted phage terminase large subunit-like protein